MKYNPKILLVLGIILVAMWLYRGINYFVIDSISQVDRIVDIAIEKNNPLLCEKIRVPFIRLPLGRTRDELTQLCFFSYAQKAVDNKICDHLADTYYKYSCIRNIGFIKNDITVCEEIAEQFEREQCRTYISTTPRDL